MPLRNRRTVRIETVAVAVLLAAFASTTHDADAQVVRDHRSGGSGDGNEWTPPSTTPSAPPPAVNGPPPTAPGEFAFQNVVSKHYLSAAGSLRMSPTRGAAEKFRIVRERGTSFVRIQSASNHYVTANADTQPPAALSSRASEDNLFSLSLRGTLSYAGAFEIALKTAPTWILLQDKDATGPKPTVSAWNVTSNARALFWITKCGDIGTGQVYALRPVGATTGSAPQRFVRQSDGTYALAFGSQRYWSATGGGGNAPGKGSDGYPIEYKDSIGAYEKFKVLDQGNCTYAIQTAKGWYLGMKAGSWNQSTISTRISDPNAAPSIGYVAYWELMPMNP